MEYKLLQDNTNPVWEGETATTGSWSHTLTAGAETSDYELSIRQKSAIFDQPIARHINGKQYEITDHLGNVRVVLSPELNYIRDPSFISPRVIATNTYYPFGMLIEPLSGNSEGYRYGFNGKEKDDQGEWGMTHYDYGFRIYNPGLGRFLSVDPLTKDYPWYTPYQFAGNKPIMAIDLDGLEEWYYGNSFIGYKVSPDISGPYSEEIMNERGLYSKEQIHGFERGRALQMQVNQEGENSSQTFIGQFNPKGLSNSYLDKQHTIRNNQYKIAEFKEVASKAHPTSFGGPNFGIGSVPALIEGIKQAPLSIVVPELVAFKLSKLAKPVMSYQKFSKVTAGSFKGGMHNTLRGSAYQSYKQALTSPLLESNTGKIFNIFSYSTDLNSVVSTMIENTPDNDEKTSQLDTDE